MGIVTGIGIGPTFGGGSVSWTAINIEAVKPTGLAVVWANDYAQIDFTDNSDGLAEHEIYEAIGAGSYSLVTTLGAGVTHYHNPTWQNASMNFKIRAKGGVFYSTYTDVINLATPLCFKTDQSSIVNVVFNNLNITAGKTVYINWGDGSDLLTVTGSNANVTKTYGVTGQYNILLSGDLNYITKIEHYSQISSYGDLTKWFLPNWENINAAGISLRLSGCSFSGNVSNWVLCKYTSLFNISSNYFTGKLPNLSVSYSTGVDYNVSDNYLTGTSLTILKKGLITFTLANQNDWFPTSEVDELLKAIADYYQVNAPTANGSFILTGDLVGVPTDGIANEDKVRIEGYYTAAGKNATITVNIPSPFDNGKIILTWDGNVSWCKDVFPVLTANSVKGTFYVTSGTVGGDGMMSWAQVQAVLAAGHDIQCHGETHADFTTLSDAALALQLQAVDTSFTANSIPSPAKHTAYPSGNISDAKILIVDNYRLTGRLYGYVRGVNSCWTNSNKYKIPNMWIEPSTSGSPDMVLIKKKILAASINKAAITMVSHGISVNGDHGSIKQSDLQEIIDYGKSLGMDFLTISELYALLD